MRGCHGISALRQPGVVGSLAENFALWLKPLPAQKTLASATSHDVIKASFFSPLLPPPLPFRPATLPPGLLPDMKSEMKVPCVDDLSEDRESAAHPPDDDDDGFRAFANDAPLPRFLLT